MRINPMVKKDIKVQARSMRCCWEIFVYEAIMAVVFFFAMFLVSFCFLFIFFQEIEPHDNKLDRECGTFHYFGSYHIVSLEILRHPYGLLKMGVFRYCSGRIDLQI